MNVKADNCIGTRARNMSARGIRFSLALRSISLSLLLTGISLAQAPTPVPTPARLQWATQYTLPSFFQVVKPMQHPLNGRMPMLLWSLPMPEGQQLVWARQSGTLRKAIDQLAARGIVPAVFIPSGDGAQALARTLQEAGQPVYLLIRKLDLIESFAWKNCTVWAEGPDPLRASRPKKWPCLALNDPAPGAQWLTAQIAPFQQAGIKINGVFYDDEGLPSAWNGIYEATVKSSECRRQYPPGVLDDFAAFEKYAIELRVKLTREMLTDPVHKLFPDAITGNFGDCLSSGQTPYIDYNNRHIPPMSCGGDAAMPVLYCNTTLLPARLPTGKPPTQELADQIYLHVSLRTLSTCAPNARTAHKKLVPYLAQAVFDNTQPQFHFGMSQPMWRELLYHVWLRGADGAFLFNLGYPKSGITADFSFRSVEEVRAVYDSLLQYREFIEKGEPMNYAYPEMYSGEPIWSGLRLPNGCLIRAFTPGPVTKTVQIKAFDGVTVTLDAPPKGATYLVGADGKVKTAE